MNVNKRIYLAGPISGKGYDEVVDLYREKSQYFSDIGYDVLCPMTGKTYLRTEINLKAHGYEGMPQSTNHAIFERDKWMVSICDVVIADLSNCGERISIGTVMELAWASMLGKHTVVVMQKDNIHQHAFVIESADIIFETMDEARKYLRSLVKGIE
jgi:nucleoside 2-deoxyribosyltransferase